MENLWILWSASQNVIIAIIGYNYTGTFIVIHNNPLSYEEKKYEREHGKDGNICDIGEDVGQEVMEVKIAFPVSHNSLKIVEEYVQWRNIA